MKSAMLGLGNVAPSPRFVGNVDEFGDFIRRQFPRGDVCQEIYIGVGDGETIECMGFDIYDFIDDYGFNVAVWESVVDRLMNGLGAKFAAIGVPLDMSSSDGAPVFAEGDNFVAIGAAEMIAVCKQRIPIHTHRGGSQTPGRTYALGLETVLDDLMIVVRRHVTPQG